MLFCYCSGRALLLHCCEILDRVVPGDHMRIPFARTRLMKESEMRLGAKVYLSAAILVLGTAQVVGQQSQTTTEPGSGSVQQAAVSAPEASAPKPPQAAHPPAAQPQKHKLGPFEITINWRTRAEGWNWFEAPTGNSDYPLWHSLLRIGIGQTREKIDWFAEMEQPSILGLPNDAVVAGPAGQLGLGGSYYVANNNQSNNASIFLKQAFVDFKHLGPTRVKLGRFEYFDGMEVKPKDPVLAAVVQSRIAHRLISNFGFTAVQRTFDGGQFSVNSGKNNFTFFGARPTAGILQTDGMPELDIEVYYGAFTRSINTPHGEAQLRVFGLGYVDDRNTILKTDNRPVPVRTADLGKVQLATYGANYAQVINTTNAGKFDFLVWGVYQGGSWGALNQRASAFVGEAGLATRREAPQALAERRLFLWQRRRQSQRLDPRNFLPGPDHAAPVCALSLLQHDEQRGFLRHPEPEAGLEAGAAHRRRTRSGWPTRPISGTWAEAHFNPRLSDTPAVPATISAAWPTSGTSAPTTRSPAPSAPPCTTAMPGARR